MQTDQLILALSTNCPPVRPVAHPAWRTIGWFAVSLVCVAASAAAMGLRPDLDAKLGDLKFLTEVGAAFLTSIMAAAAAFCAGCPGTGHLGTLCAGPLSGALAGESWRRMLERLADFGLAGTRDPSGLGMSGHHSGDQHFAHYSDFCR